MKKLISILASLTLVASSSSAVVSCSSRSTSKSADSYVNNDINNIMAASFEKAKQIIINNEYGIDQSIVKGVQSNIKVSDDSLKDINYKDLTNKQDSTVSDLVSQYYGDSSEDNTDINGGNQVDLGGTTGVSSSLDYILVKVMNFLKIPAVIQNAVLKNKNMIISFLTLGEDTVNMGNLNDLANNMYSAGSQGFEYFPNQLIKMGINYIQSQITKEGDKGTFHTIATIILNIFAAKDTFANTTLPGIFKSSSVMDALRGVINGLFAKGTTQSVIQDDVYGNKVPDYSKLIPSSSDKPDTKSFAAGDAVTAIKDIKVQNIKYELLASLDRIAHELFSADAITTMTNGIKALEIDPNEPDDSIKTQVDDLQVIITGLVEMAIEGRFDGTKIKSSDGKTETPLFSDDILKPTVGSIMNLVWEALRDICIINAQFSVYEQANSMSAQDSQHLFGEIDSTTGKKVYKQNYDFINETYDKTLGEFDYINAGDTTLNDEPINLNYFMSNLNYFIGDISNANDEAAYRFQQLAFILFNDPSDPKTVPDGNTSWSNRKSNLLSFIVNLGLNIGQTALNYEVTNNPSNTTYPLIQGIINNDLIGDPANVLLLENMIIKPLLLGITNGDSFQVLAQTLVGALEGALTIPGVSNALNNLLSLIGTNVQEIIDALNRLIDSGFANDTVHNLFVDDFRYVIKPLSFIPQNVIDMLFGANDPVNLFTLMNMPLNKLLSILNVPGFEGGKILPIGDYFTTKSIPQLLNLIDNLLNGMGSDAPYIDKNADGTIDYTKSLKARDLDFIALNDLFNSIVGTNTTGTYVGDTDNIFSRVLHDFIKSDVSGCGTQDSNTHKWTWDLSNFNKLSLVLDPLDTNKDLGIMDQQPNPAPSKSAIKLDSLVSSNRFDDGDTTPSLGSGVYDDSTKTITFKGAKNIKNPTIYDGTSPKVEGNIWVTSTIGGPQIASATYADGTGLVITFTNSIEMPSASKVTVHYQGPKDAITAGVNIPSLFPYGDAVFLKPTSLFGALFRVNLPMIDKDTKQDIEDGNFRVKPEYLKVDFLHDNYVNMITLLNYFNTPGYYGWFVDQMLSNQQSFDLKYDFNNPSNISYFTNNPSLIRQIKFTVEFKNYTVGSTDSYVFTASRNSNIEAFKITNIITDKTN